MVWFFFAGRRPVVKSPCRNSYRRCLLSLLVGYICVSSQLRAEPSASASGYIDGPAGLSVDVKGNIYVAERGGHRIIRIDGESGGISTVAGNGHQCCYEEGQRANKTSIAYPVSVAVDRYQNLYIADS